MGHFDRQVESFRAMGLTEAAATIAVIGRRPESEVRAVFAEMDATDAALREAQAAKAAAAPVTTASTGSAGAVGLAEAIAAVEIAAQGALNMDAAAAKSYAVQISEREVANAGPAHADRYLRTFARGLQVQA